MFSKIFQILESVQNSWNVSRNVLPLCNPNSVWFLMWSDCFFNIARVSLVVVWRSLGYLRWLLGCYAGFTFQCFFLACPVSRVFWTVDCVIFLWLLGCNKCNF